MCIMLSLLTCNCLTMVPLYMVAIASYHSGAHLMKPQFPVKLRTTLSQGCHISYNLVTTLPLYKRLLLGCYNLVRLSTGCDNLGISIWDCSLPVLAYARRGKPIINCTAHSPTCS